MSISVSVTSQERSQGNHAVPKQRVQTSTIPSLNRPLRAVASGTVTTSGRPVSLRRAALLQTDEGRAKIAGARHSLSNALSAYGAAPVAALRLRAGLSQKELCEKTGILQPHLSRLENGHVPMPEVATLHKLAEALHVSLDEVTAAFRLQSATT
jgi:DNA-binding Xre family transcriptional regulator